MSEYMPVLISPEYWDWYRLEHSEFIPMDFNASFEARRLDNGECWVRQIDNIWEAAIPERFITVLENA